MDRKVLLQVVFLACHIVINMHLTTLDMREGCFELLCVVLYALFSTLMYCSYSPIYDSHKLSYILFGFFWCCLSWYWLIILAVFYTDFAPPPSWPVWWMEVVMRFRQACGCPGFSYRYVYSIQKMLTSNRTT